MLSIGQKGELAVADWLTKNKYTVVAKNFRMRTGEIDIIAIDTEDDCLAFIEVKTLPNTQFEDLDLIINKKKQIRIAKTAKYFLETNRKYNKMCMRFDVIVLKSNPFLSQPLDIIHLKDAFGDWND